MSESPRKHIPYSHARVKRPLSIEGAHPNTTCQLRAIRRGPSWIEEVDHSASALFMKRALKRQRKEHKNGATSVDVLSSDNSVPIACIDAKIKTRLVERNERKRKNLSPGVDALCTESNRMVPHACDCSANILKPRSRCCRHRCWTQRCIRIPIMLFGPNFQEAHA